MDKLVGMVYNEYNKTKEANTMKYKIMTEGRKYYVIDEQNRICRTDVKFPPTSAWRCIGVREVRAFGNRGPIIPLNEAIKHDTRFKNGRGKFVMVDFDHGTCREWGDRIVFIWEC